jgi:alkylation response protein AidB-like acyl-CoA dehydrogenase
MLWTSAAAQLEVRLETLRRFAVAPGPGGRRLADDPLFRDAFAALAVDVEAVKLMGYRGFARSARGEASPEHSVLKLFASEVTQRLTLTALEHAGAAGLDVEIRDPTQRFADRPWALQWLFSFAGTIAGGTSEIQRNIIAQRVLGLPR